MGGRSSKNYEETTKESMPNAADRTRSKCDAYYKTLAGAHVNSSSSQSEEATDLNPAAVALRKQKNVMRQWLDGASAPHEGRGQQKRRIIQLEHANRGNKSNMYPEEFEIERITAAEFKGKRTNSTSMIERIDVAEFRCKKIHSTSTIERIEAAEFRGKRTNSTSRIERIDKVEFISKRIDYMSKIGRNDVAELRSKRTNLTSKIESIDAARFRNKRTNSTPETGDPARQELHNGLSAAISWKNIDSLGKPVPHAGCYGFFSPRGASQCFHEGYFSQGEADNEDFNCEEIDIERIEKAEFMKFKKCIGAIIDGANFRSENIEVNQTPEPQTLHALPLQFRFEDEAPKEEETEYEKEMGCLYAELDLNWALEGVGSFNCPEIENINSESKEKQSDKSSSLAGKGNNDEDADIEIIEIERIDGFKFRNKRRQIAATSGEKNDCVCEMMPFTKETDELGKKRGVSASSRNGEDLHGKFSQAVDDSPDECMISESSSHSNSASADASREDYKVGSFGSGLDSDLGIASRTRSKMRNVKQPSAVDPDELNSTDESDLSTDSEFCSSDDEEFKGDNSIHSDYDGIEILRSYNEEPDAQNSILMEVSEKGEHCLEHGQSDALHPSKRRRFIKHQNISTNCNPHSSKRHKFSERNMQPSNVAPRKKIKGQRTCKTSEVNNEKEKISRTVPHDANEDGLNHRNDDKRDEMQTCKHSNPQMNCDEVDGANIMLPQDPSQGGTRHQKKLVSTSRSNDDCDPSDHGSNNVGYDGHDENIGNNEKVRVANEIKKQSKGTRTFPKQYDMCKMLADSVLEQGPETKECGVEYIHAHEPQILNALQLKFRFEDEEPEEEKSEYQKEMENLYAELDFNWALEEVGFPEANQENSPTEETQHERCARGKHELVLEDDEGLFCAYCGYVMLEPRDILPQWAEKVYRQSERKRSEVEEYPDFDALCVQLSLENYADISNSTTGTVWSIKPGIQESMYEHQKEGFEFLWRNLAGSINISELNSTNPCGVGGCIISHAPGTGKTRLTIVFIETYLKMFPNCLPVIIAPASMLLTWEEEFKKWNVEFPFHNLNNLEISGKENAAACKLLDGVKRQNKDTIRMVKIFSWNKGRSILGISYSLFEKLTAQKSVKEKTFRKRKRTNIDGKMEALRTILLEKPGLVVLDEGHTPRNQRSNIWKVLLELKTEKRVILSGTPFQNNFAELFNTLRIVRPAMATALAQEKTFAEMIASRRMCSRKNCMGENFEPTLIPEAIDRAVEKLKISMSPFVHVHKGTILQENLPGLRDCVVLLKPPALQKRLIERLEGLPCTFKFEHEVALISVHPYLFQYCTTTEEQRHGIDMEAVEASKLNPNKGVKTKFVLEFVRLSMAMHEKVLIFSQYIQPLELIKEQLEEMFDWMLGKQILKLDGKLDQRQRQKLINSFNDPKSESKIMLASTRCCSEGISLVGASRVILLDVVWNPSVERQAISRAYRIGQKKIVHTYHLMTSGTTEANKYDRQVEKERLSDLVFSFSSNESNIQKHHLLGIEDKILEEMFVHPKLKEMFEKISNRQKIAN